MNNVLQEFLFSSQEINVFCFSVFFIFYSSTEIAQTGKLSGKVTDENGEPLVGANVLVEETTGSCL